jgi:hypothetical protein
MRLREERRRARTSNGKPLGPSAADVLRCIFTFPREIAGLPGLTCAFAASGLSRFAARGGAAVASPAGAKADRTGQVAAGAIATMAVHR